jgi:hypothetical protein
MYVACGGGGTDVDCGEGSVSRGGVYCPAEFETDYL